MKSINKRFLASLILTALLVLTLNGCVETPDGEIPQTSGSNVSKTSGNSEMEIQTITAQTNTNLIRIWRDFSKSGNEEVWAKYIDDFIKAIERHKTQISGVEVVRFANGETLILEEKTEKFVWGDFPQFKDFQPDLENAPQNTKMFQDALKKYIDEQKATYETKKAQIINSHEKDIKEQLIKLQNYLLQPPTVSASCTRFTELATRVKQENLSKNLTITDGWADCVNETISTISPVEIQGKHTIVQITKSSDTQANSAELKQREFFLHTLFPSAEIFPVYSLDKAIESLFTS